jgi:hypothetical protein
MDWTDRGASKYSELPYRSSRLIDVGVGPKIYIPASQDFYR